MLYLNILKNWENIATLGQKVLNVREVKTRTNSLPVRSPWKLVLSLSFAYNIYFSRDFFNFRSCSRENNLYVYVYT